jgi:hypothetical protein
MAESPVMAGEHEDQDDQRTQPVPHGSPELQAEPPPGTPYGGAPQVVPGQQYGPPPQPQQYGPPQYLQPQRLQAPYMQQPVPPRFGPARFGPPQYAPAGPSFGPGPYGPGGGPGSGQVPVVLAAVLALVAAALAVAGTFGTFLSFESTSTYGGRSSTSTSASTGWGETVEPASGYATTSNLQGLPLVIGAVLLVVAGLWLGLRRGAAPSSARALGAAGAGILVAATLMIWLTINAAARNSTAYVRSRDSAPRPGGAVEIEQTVGPGAGAWLVLVAGILALVVAVVLVAGARSAERRPG